MAVAILADVPNQDKPNRQSYMVYLFSFLSVLLHIGRYFSFFCSPIAVVSAKHVVIGVASNGGPLLVWLL